ALEDRCVSSRRQRRYNRRFKIIGRRDAGGLNLRLLCVFPVVVSDDRAIRPVQFKYRICQYTTHLNRWSKSADDCSLQVRPRDDEATDKNVITREHMEPCGDVQQLGRRIVKLSAGKDARAASIARCNQYFATQQ